MAAPGDNIHQRSMLYATYLRDANVDPLISDRTAPTTTPTSALLARSSVVGVNGRKVVKKQAASVQWLPNNEKLQLPWNLKGADARANYDDEDKAIRAVGTLKFVAGFNTIAPGDRYNHIVAGGANTAGDITTWHTSHATSVTTTPKPADLELDFELTIGLYDENSVFHVIANTDEDRIAFGTWTYGADANHIIQIGLPLAAQQADPVDGPALMALEGAEDQLSDIVSASLGLNYSIRDRNVLNQDRMRWNDDKEYTGISEDQWIPNLAPYTIAMISALNMTAVGGNARLAWTRGYGVAFGMLPSENSSHNIEYQLTTYLPESSELDAVISAHPTGEDGQRYVRGCLSLLAAFGACHLANDHTYVQNDDNLLRKAAVYVNACRTTLDVQEAERLVTGQTLKHAIRTAAHPFGLASTWAAFCIGRRLNIIAEPLRIRAEVVPPDAAVIGLVVSVMDEIYALPIGKHFRTAFATETQTLNNLRETIVSNATSYSNLHRYYGKAAKVEVPAADRAKAEALLPMVAGYAEVFHLSIDNRPQGALLALSIARVQREKNGLVSLYRNAFGKYLDSAQDIPTLISGGTSTNTRGGGTGGGTMTTTGP